MNSYSFTVTLTQKDLDDLERMNLISGHVEVSEIAKRFEQDITEYCFDDILRETARWYLQDKEMADDPL